jgi:hypothetical protein
LTLVIVVSALFFLGSFLDRNFVIFFCFCFYFEIYVSPTYFTSSFFEILTPSTSIVIK